MGKDHGKIKERASTEKKNTHKISNRNRASEHAILKSSDWKTHSLCLTGIKRFLKLTSYRRLQYTFLQGTLENKKEASQKFT